MSSAKKPQSGNGRKRARYSQAPRYREIPIEVVVLSSLPRADPKVLLREPDAETWSVEMLIIENNFINGNLGVWDAAATSHAIHQILVRVPDNQAAMEEFGDDAFGIGVRYLGVKPTGLAHDALVQVAADLEFDL